MPDIVVREKTRGFGYCLYNQNCTKTIDIYSKDSINLARQMNGDIWRAFTQVQKMHRTGHKGRQQKYYNMESQGLLFADAIQQKQLDSSENVSALRTC